MSPVPASISGNRSGLAYAEEQSLKVLPGGPVWYGLEPNTFADLGSTISTVARSPINALRKKNKGNLIDLDAKAGWNQDLTQRNLTRLLQGFFFADAIEKPATNKFTAVAIPFTSVAVGPNKYNAAAGLDQFLVNHLVIGKGFANAANNGIHKITAVLAGSLTTTDATTAEAAPPAGASLEAIGYVFPAGDLALTVVGATAVLTSATINPTTFGLTVGEWIYVGGDAAGEAYAVSPRFFGRVSAVNATQIIFDLTIAGVPVADAGAAKTIKIFFGKVLRDAVVIAQMKRRSYQLERTLGDDGGGTQSEYVVGAIPNEITINLSQGSKATVDMTFIGLDNETRNGALGVKGGTRVAAPGEDAYNTSHDILASRIAVIDPATFSPAALYGYAQDIKLQIKNNLTPNKALAVLGAFEVNEGDFEVTGTLTAYFASVAATAAVRANSDVCLTTVLARQNSGTIIDVPLIGLGNGINKVEKDKPITTDVSTDAGQSRINGYTLLWNFFEYLPTAAMPV